MEGINRKPAINKVEIQIDFYERLKYHNTLNFLKSHLNNWL